jgi:hypothetical protein
VLTLVVVAQLADSDFWVQFFSHVTSIARDQRLKNMVPLSEWQQTQQNPKRDILSALAPFVQPFDFCATRKPDFCSARKTPRRHDSWAHSINELNAA